MENNYIGLILIAVGVFSLAGGIFNWDWFMNQRKSKIIVKIFKRTGARIFYSVLGSVIAVIGLLVLTGAVK